MNPDERRSAPYDGPEVDTLLGMLDYHRDTLRWKCDGLTDEQLRRRLAPTDMTLAGLLLHMAMVEGGWFNLTFGGKVTKPGWLDEVDQGDPDWEWKHAADFSGEQLRAWHDEACAVSDQVVQGALATDEGLDATVEDDGQRLSLRWIVVHMIEEYARHNGHADLLRQSVDGETGD